MNAALVLSKINFDLKEMKIPSFERRIFYFGQSKGGPLEIVACGKLLQWLQS